MAKNASIEDQLAEAEKAAAKAEQIRAEVEARQAARAEAADAAELAVFRRYEKDVLPALEAEHDAAVERLDAAVVDPEMPLVDVLGAHLDALEASRRWAITASEVTSGLNRHAPTGKTTLLGMPEGRPDPSQAAYHHRDGLSAASVLERAIRARAQQAHHDAEAALLHERTQAREQAMADK